MDPKKAAFIGDAAIPAPPTYQQTLKDPDRAYDFLASIGATDAAVSEVDIKALRRKVDWHIVPLMFLCYTMQFIDKVSLNYAAVMGLLPDLKLKGNDFSNAATAFFIAYLIAEVPTGKVELTYGRDIMLMIPRLHSQQSTSCQMAGCQCHPLGTWTSARSKCYPF